jgi:hypothetical protein
MIGGSDVIIPTRADTAAFDVAVRAIRREWPEAVFENAETGDRFIRYSELPFGEISELFVYRSADFFDAWDDPDAGPLRFSTMIHLLGGEGDLTVVVHDRNDPQVQRMLDSMHRDLQMDILNTPIPYGAAA